MTATRSNWRVKVKRGDVLSVSATYDSKRALVVRVDGDHARGLRARRARRRRPVLGQARAARPLTHGHLPENDNHGGDAGGLADARTLPDGPAATADPLAITDFLYGQGDLLRGGAAVAPAGRRARAVAGVPQRRRRAHDLPHHHLLPRALQPLDRDRLPARRRARSSSTRASSASGPPGFTPAANRDTWSTPANLGPGTYTYFCRVHPFMRGAFRVKELSRAAAGGVAFRHGRHPHTHAACGSSRSSRPSMGGSSPST